MKELLLSLSSKTQKCALKYDVFLSFRGRDTRHNFVHSLHEALGRVGISAFKDDIDLRKGERIRQELFNAIDECRIAIVILSKNYAASEWCLEELAKIMKRKSLTIFPVFYDVCPSDVRHLKGSFAQAFAEHERNHEPEKLTRWKRALSDVADISGFDLLNHPYNRDQSKCIQDIVREVQRTLKNRREDHYIFAIISQSFLDEKEEQMKIDGGGGAHFRDQKGFNLATSIEMIRLLAELQLSQFQFLFHLFLMPPVVISILACVKIAKYAILESEFQLANVGHGQLLFLFSLLNKNNNGYY